MGRGLLMAATETGIHVERDGDVVVLTIDRPEVRNALHPAALFALATAIDDATADPAINAAVLTHTGDKSFSSGMDLRALRDRDPDVSAAVGRFDGVLGSPDRLPIVAAVAANAVGGGFELMLKCDMAVAATGVVFALPEVGRGMVPGGGATLLPARVPIAIAMELAVLGEPMAVDRAYELGLVNRVVPASEVVETAVGLAHRIGENAPGAVAATRRLLWTTFYEGATVSWQELRSGGQGEDPRRAAEAAEGLAAFTEKRKPRWRLS